MGSRGAATGSTICVLLLTLVITLIAMSAKRLEANTAGVAYNTVTRSLSDEVTGEGLHWPGPTSKFIVFDTTQRRAKAHDVTVLTKDSIEAQLDVQLLYTIKKEEIPAALDRFYDQDGQRKFIDIYMRSIVRTTAATFTAKQFNRQRTDFQRALLLAVQQRFNADNVTHVSVDSVQVLDIILPAATLQAMERAALAEQEIGNASSERTTKIQAATIRLDRARSEAQLQLIEAARDVLVVEQMAREAIAVEEQKMQVRADAFSNVSTGLGQGGDFFVQSYLKYLVLQSNAGQTVITT